MPAHIEIENIKPEMAVWVVNGEGASPVRYVVDAVIEGFVSVRAKGSLHYTIPMWQIVRVEESEMNRVEYMKTRVEHYRARGEDYQTSIEWARLDADARFVR